MTPALCRQCVLLGVETPSPVYDDLALYCPQHWTDMFGSPPGVLKLLVTTADFQNIANQVVLKYADKLSKNTVFRAYGNVYSIVANRNWTTGNMKEKPPAVGEFWVVSTVLKVRYVSSGQMFYVVANPTRRITVDASIEPIRWSVMDGRQTGRYRFFEETGNAISPRRFGQGRDRGF